MKNGDCFPLPLHRYGYPKSQIEKIFIDAGCDELIPEFWYFMRGQTCARDDKTKETIVYECDFINFFQRAFWD